MGRPYNENGKRKDPKKGTEREIPSPKTSWTTKNPMGGCCAEGCITDISDVRMEDKSRKQG
jgi:hypothetical protein